jgi:UDP-N-acetylmuramyl pentapeptide synthase
MSPLRPALHPSASAHCTNHTAPASALVKGSRFMRMERVVHALQISATAANKESTDAA